MERMSLKDHLQASYNQYRIAVDDIIADLSSNYGDYDEAAKLCNRLSHFGHIIDVVDKLETNRYALSDRQIHESMYFGVSYICEDRNKSAYEMVLRVGTETLVFDTALFSDFLDSVLIDTNCSFGDIFLNEEQKIQHMQVGSQRDVYNVYVPVVEISFPHNEQIEPYHNAFVTFVDSFNQYFELGQYYTDLDDDALWDPEGGSPSEVLEELLEDEYVEM